MHLTVNSNTSSTPAAGFLVISALAISACWWALFRPATTTDNHIFSTETTNISALSPNQLAAPLKPAIAKTFDKKILDLKMSTKIESVDFPLGSFSINEGMTKSILAFSQAQETLTAEKIHITGFSGGRNVPKDERSKLSFNRAFATKLAMVDAGIPAKKMRLFYFSNDHLGAPRAEFKAYKTLNSSDEAATSFLHSSSK
jgi:outer membrane protein OmpA-like peptidoglycan-associated protein